MKDWLNDTTYKDVVIEGATFKGKPYQYREVVLNNSMKTIYLPELQKANASKGMKLLITAMAHMEGFFKGSRSFENNNPGNIGNTDSGKNKKLPTLLDGINLQIGFINDICAGKKSSYPLGKQVNIKPYYSEEIARNATKYQKSPYVPGYKFIFTGQLDQFVKIYSTGARSGNTYLNTIVSYFKQNGIIITPENKLQDIIKL